MHQGCGRSDARQGSEPRGILETSIRSLCVRSVLDGSPILTTLPKPLTTIVFHLDHVSMAELASQMGLFAGTQMLQVVWGDHLLLIT